MQVTASFRGLCTFIERGNGFEAYLLSGASGGGPPTHVPQLAIRYEHVDHGPTWLPSAISRDIDNHPLLIWNLRGQDVIFNTPGVSGKWPQGERDKAVDLRRYHQQDGLVIDEPALERVSFCKIRLERGSLTSESQQNFLITHHQTQPGGKVEPVATEIRWSTPGSLTVASAEGRIGVKPGAQLNVQNVSPLTMHPNPAHFNFYYEIFRPHPPHVRLTVIPQMIATHETVFDCVPPTGTP